MKVKLLGREWDVEFEPYFPRDRYEWRWWLYSRGGSWIRDDMDDWFPTKHAAREDLLTFLKEHGGEVLE